MSESSRRFLIGLALLLLGGLGIGAIYGMAERGLLIAMAVALIWQVRHLLAFAKALQTRDFSFFRDGDGIWQWIFSQFSYNAERAARYKRQYRRLLKEIRRSTDALPDGAVMLDVNNDIIICNKAAKSLAGLKPKKDRGQRVDNLLRAPQLNELLAAQDYNKAIEIPSPVIEGGWLNCRVVPYGADQKLLILRDVTERNQLSKMRREFVANASHELRSPLTVISGYLDGIAEDPNVPADWQKPMHHMQAQAARMNRIVAELLELSRLESAGPAGDNDVVDVPALLFAARDAVYSPGETPEIDIVAESAVHLRGSSAEIESVVSNLLSNAVRHTPPSGRVTLTWRSDAECAELRVEDTGEGIDPLHLPRLTERFFRVDKGRARHDGGVGLGLAIVKHVLGRHDAELEIESEVGTGSLFVCRFPVSRFAMKEPIPLTGDRANG